MIEANEAKHIITSMVIEAQSILMKILALQAEKQNFLHPSPDNYQTSTTVFDPYQLLRSPVEDLQSQSADHVSRKRSREHGNKPKDSMSTEQLEAKRAADRLRQQKYRIKLKQRMTPEAYAKKLESDRRRKQESRKRLKLKQGKDQDMSVEDSVSTEEDASDSSSEITAYHTMPHSMEGAISHAQYFFTQSQES